MIQAVLFDWGDTVMRVFPQFPGPMSQWPRVEAIPGIAEALAALQGRYVLALATNAADSGEKLVRAALSRVDLDRYFEYVLTARELGARKPDRAFFQVAVHALGFRPEEAVMVGDDYDADVVGARLAGLRAVWFKPTGTACHAADCQADAIVSCMADLPAAIAGL